MSKKDRGSPSEFSSGGAAFIMHYDELQHIEGKVLTVVESIGMSEKQENAVKGLLRQAIWQDIHTSYRLQVFEENWEQLRKSNEERSKGVGSVPHAA